MHEMIEAIRCAVTDGATPEQKGAGIVACRAILAALEAEPGKALVVAGVPAPSPLAGIPPDQALDLLIARLSMIAEKRDASPTAPPAKTAPPLRIAFVPTPARRKP